MLGTSTATPCNRWLLGVSRARFIQGSMHSEVAWRLREILMTRDNRVDSSWRKVQEISSLYISVDPVHRPSSVLSERTKTDIDGRVVRVIEEGKAV